MPFCGECAGGAKGAAGCHYYPSLLEEFTRLRIVIATYIAFIKSIIGITKIIFT